MRRMKDASLAIICLLLGVYLAFGKNLIRGKSLLNTDNFWNQADTYIKILGGLLMVVSLILLFRTLLQTKDKKQSIDRDANEHKFIAIIVVSMILFVLLLPKFGFFINSLWFTALFCFLIMVKERQISRQSDKSILFKAVLSACVYSLILVTFLQTIFKYLLKVSLP